MNIEQEHSCNATFTNTGEEMFGVKWMRADSLDHARLHPRAAKKVWLGVCGFSHRVFKTAGDGQIELVVFNDLAIVNGRCEEESRCLAQQCPLNKTPDSMLKKLLRTRDKVEREQIGVLVRGFTRLRHCGLFKSGSSEGGIMLPSPSNSAQRAVAV
jgi:hypothetical protein